MGAFLYGISLQFKMDIRSRSLLVTCYLVPLLFFAVMGGIFTSIMPGSEKTLIQSMTVMGVSMGALIGVPPSLAEIYGTDVRKMYQANGAPLWYGLITLTVSAFIHLLIMSGIILAAAPVMFHAEVPSGLLLYFVKLSLFIIASLGIAGVLGMLEKNQAKLTMLCQAAFLPSILLSGIMFPSSLLPGILEKLGKVFPLLPWMAWVRWSVSFFRWEARASLCSRKSPSSMNPLLWRRWRVWAFSFKSARTVFSS